MGKTAFVTALVFFLADLAALAKLSLAIPRGFELQLGMLAVLALGAAASLAGLALDAPWGWRIGTVIFGASVLDAALLFAQTGPTLLLAGALAMGVVGLLITSLSSDPDHSSRPWRPPPPNLKVYHAQRPLDAYDERPPRVMVERDMP